MADDKKGGAKSEAGQLFIDFGASGLGKLVKGLNSLSASFLLTKNGAEQALKPIMSMSQNAGKSVTSWDKLNAVTGISIKQLQRMQAWAELNNVSFGDMMGQVQTLQKKLYNLQMGRGGNIAGFSLLGIDPRSLDLNSPIEALDTILARVSQLAETQPAIAANALEELGLSRDLLYAYQQQNTAIDERLMLNDNEIATLKQQQTGWNTLKVTADSALQKIISEQSWINPALMKCSEIITNLILKIGDLKSWFDKLAESEGFQAFMVLVKGTFNVGKGFVNIYKQLYDSTKKTIGEPLGELDRKIREMPTSVKKERLLVDPIALAKYNLLINQNKKKMEDEQNKFLASQSKINTVPTKNKITDNNLFKPVTKKNISSPFNLQPISDIPATTNPILPVAPPMSTGNNNNVNVNINQNITAPSPEEAGRKSAVNIQDSMNEILERQNLAGL